MSDSKSADGFLTILLGKEVATVTIISNGVPMMICACCLGYDNKKLLVEALERNVPTGVVVAMTEASSSIFSNRLVLTNEEPSFLKRSSEKHQLLLELKSLESYSDSEINKSVEAAQTKLRAAKRISEKANEALYYAECAVVKLEEEINNLNWKRHIAPQELAKISDVQKKIEDFGDDGLVMY